MGITSALPRRGPSQSVPPPPNGSNQFPIQSTPKFQQSLAQAQQNNQFPNPSSLNQTQSVDRSLATASTTAQRAIPVSEVYFDMIQEDDDCDDDDDECEDDYDDYDESDPEDEDDRRPRMPSACPSSVHDVNTGAIFHIVDNPVYGNDLPRPKVGPLTPLEIAEYERCGIELKRTAPPLPLPPVRPPRKARPATPRRYRCKSRIRIEPKERCSSPMIRRRSCSRGRSLVRTCSMPDTRPDMRPVPLTLRSVCQCLTAYEIDYARKIFDRMCSPDDGRVSFSGFLKLCRRMSPRLAQQRGFMHRAAYHFRIADSNCDGRISFDEFLFAYVRSREAVAAAAVINSALDSGCAMNEPTRSPISTSPCPSVARRRRPSRYRCVPVPVTNYQPDYLSDIDRQTVPIKDLAKKINNIYDSY